MQGYTKTFIFLAALTGLFGGIGYAIAGAGGAIIALLIAVGMNFFTYWNADKIVLNMYGAREVSAQNGGKYYQIVADLAQKARMPMPRVYIMETEQPNAFATGRSPEHAAVAATTGLLNYLSDQEIAGVMAHELAHVRNRDSLIMTITATIAGAISAIANFAFIFSMTRDEEEQTNPFVGLLLMILAPIAATIVQLAISRSREYEADRIGAEICGHPNWLASALGKIEHYGSQTHNQAAESHPATAHMFIMNPLHGSSFASLFSTHPSTEERIARLSRMVSTSPTKGTSSFKTEPTQPPRTSSKKSRTSVPKSGR